MTMPQAWLEDRDLAPGDRLDIYRDTSDRLIIMPPERPATASDIRGRNGGKL